MEKGSSLLSQNDRLWLAALIDGEGCIHIQKRGTCPSERLKNFSYQPWLLISMTCKEIIDKVLHITNRGTIRIRPEALRRKKQYGWRIVGQDCTDILREVYPFLIEKKKMAACAIHISEKNADRTVLPKKGQQGFRLRLKKDTDILESYYLLWKRSMNRELVTVPDPMIVLDNIHRHAFVLEMADVVFETEEEAMVYLKKLVSREI
jgi:hypothetical protein